MNIFKWITGRAGKMALSAAQAVGLSAVVGVAGIAAWQYLDAPADNTAFNPAAQYNPGEIVYVAGASGGAYGANGEVQSAFRAKPSKAIEMTEKMTLAQQRAEELDDSVTIPSSAAPSDPRAYQMGGTEGLGMGGNRANEQDLKNNPMALVQQSMAGVSEAVSRAQAQAQGQAAAAAGQAPAGQAPAGTLASATRDWGSSAATKGISGGGGNSFNSSFSIQDSGKNTGKGAAGAANMNVGDVLASAQARANQMMEGTHLRSRSSFGKDDGMGGSRDTVGGNARNSKEGKDLEFIRKRSADAAKNKNRAANEGSRAFLASTRISGGMTVVGDNVTTGQGQDSQDFDAVNEVNLRGIKAWGVSAEEEALLRQKDRQTLLKWMWSAIGVALAAMIAIPFLKNITVLGIPVGLIAAIIMAVAATAVCVVGFVKAAQYANRWGGEGLSTALMIITPLMTAGVWASFIWATAFKNFYTNILDKLGLGSSGGSGGAGGGLITQNTLPATGADALTNPLLGGGGGLA